MKDNLRKPLKFNTATLALTYTSKLKNVVVGTNRGSVQIFSV